MNRYVNLRCQTGDILLVHIFLLPLNLLKFNIYCSFVLIYSVDVSLFFNIIHGSVQY